MVVYIYSMRILSLILLVILLSCKNDANENSTVAADLQKESKIELDLTVYDFEGLRPYLKTMTDSVYVVNFWATWCAPCIKEMPYFEAINKKYKNKGVKVTLVSLDFPRKYESHLKPFIKKNKLTSEVVVLNDPDSNSWIPEINPDWSGAIPATLIFSKDNRAFYEQPFTFEELEAELLKFIN